MTVYYNGLTLLPVLTFYVLDAPHDCFACLGKDPDRIYSIFQLTTEQRTRREAVAKFNSADFNALTRSDAAGFISDLLESNGRTVMERLTFK